MKLFFNDSFQLSAIYYPAGCDNIIPPHYCNSCDVAELGRVRSVAFIKKTFAFVDPTSAVEWRAGVASGSIIVIPEVLGSFNGGDPIEGTGYGDRPSRLTGYNFELPYKDPNYPQNADFYNSIKFARNWKVAFRTQNFTHISNSTVSIIPKNPITEDITSEVVWDVLVKFSQADIPTPVSTPETIFECFEYVGGDSGGGASGLVFDTVLTFVDATDDDAFGMGGGAAAMDPELQFQFNRITGTLTGTPINMSVMLGGVEQIAITTQTDYVGHQFRLVSATGDHYLGTVASGNVTPTPEV